MNFIHADIFFFISSLGFIILGLLGAAFIVLCIKAALSLVRILAKIEQSMDRIGDATIDLIDDVRGNPFFRMFFHSRKKPRVRSHTNEVE